MSVTCDWFITDVDLVSPLCSQVTYEGLLDDIFGIQCGVVEFGPEVTGSDKPVKVPLNSQDEVCVISIWVLLFTTVSWYICMCIMVYSFTSYFHLVELWVFRCIHCLSYTLTVLCIVSYISSMWFLLFCSCLRRLEISTSLLFSSCSALRLRSYRRSHL